MAVGRFIDFLKNSPTPFHAVDQCRNMLNSNGFIEINEKSVWKLANNGKYYFTRNKSSLFAFCIGGKFDKNGSFSIIAAHTDSPCLKLKQNTTKKKQNYNLLSLECYGGGIWSTWFDRDLTVAGLVIYKSSNSLKSSLINLEKPITRISHLAIHLNRDINDNLGLNKEAHLNSIFSTDQYNLIEDIPSQSIYDAVAKKLSINTIDIVECDLRLADCEKPTLGGLNDEFIFSGRLDNLFSVFTATESLSASSDTLKDNNSVRVMVCYDNEEVGSESYQGASSRVLESLLKRIYSCLVNDNNEDFERALASSYLISADQAHAVHPNYSDKHEENHKPEFHQGVVIKYNSNQRYATSSITSGLFRVIANLAEIPIQKFMIRNDMACGSTVGPIVAARLGIRTIDIGFPMLSMHSIREMCCITSVQQAINLFSAYYSNYDKLENNDL